jgi:glycerate 2-kinase
VSLNILIAPDKFKGTLTARAAAEAIARGWRKTRPDDSLELLPVSDGGDGFGSVLSESIGARSQTIITQDAAHQQIKAHWWWEPKSRTAIIESANVIGLAMLPPGKFHPFELDTLGLGAVIGRAAEKGARRCIIGIGGSATNDGGFGMARALGWKFLDRSGTQIERWTELYNLERILAPRRRRWFREMVVAVDVNNALFGPRGATRIYGPQKGLRPEDFPEAERCLRRLAAVVKRQFGQDFAREPGAGAAGGLGFGLRAFLGARFEPGFDLIARHARLSQRLRAAKLVITGEGAIDASTMMGKGAGQIARLCREAKIPCIALAGVVADGIRAKRLFTGVWGLTELTAVSGARSRAAFWLERLAVRTASRYSGAER